jgi:hypothetical protein
MKDSFHCDEKKVFFDFIILKSDNTLIDIRNKRKKVETRLSTSPQN